MANHEAEYFDSLRRIGSYQSVERLRKSSEKEWGVPFEQALEMAYENIQMEARNAIRGRRRPKLKEVE